MGERTGSHAPEARPGPAILLTLLSTSCYGFVPMATRLAVDNGVASLDVTFVRTCVMIFALAAAAAVLKQSFAIPKRLRRSFGWQTVATFVVSTAYLASVQFIPVSLAAILFYTSPIIVLVASSFVDKQTFGLDRLFIVLLAFAGLIVALGLDVGGLDWRGIALALFAACFFAVQAFTGRRLAESMPAAAFGCLVHVAIWPATLALALWNGQGSIGVLSGGATAGAVLGAAIVSVGYVGGYLLQMTALRHAGPSVVAPFTNWEPVVSIALAIIILGERPTGVQYAGMAVVIGALVLAGALGTRVAKPLQSQSEA